MSKSNEHNLPEMMVDCSHNHKQKIILTILLIKPIRIFISVNTQFQFLNLKDFLLKFVSLQLIAELLNCSRVWQIYEKAEITSPYSYDCYIPHCTKDVDWRYNEYGIFEKTKNQRLSRSLCQLV